MNIYELTVDQVTPGEIIANGVVVTIEGVLVVFLILVLIMLVINVMGALSSPKKQKKVVSVKQEETVFVDTNPETDVADEGELIAVLTAAVAACMGTSSASVNIKSYKKVSSAWGTAAKREVLEKF